MQQADVAGKIDWEVHFERWNDYPCSPTLRGRKGGEPETQALGRSVGGFSTKVHIKALMFW